MSITYTNRKGRTYYLCQGITKTGKPRYFFAREPKGKPVEQIPEGYDIRESVNGVVSLAKIRPVEILPQEMAAVEAEVQRHPKIHNYQIDVQGDRIVVYERVGADPEELIPEMKRLGLMIPGRGARLREILDRRARFSPVLRFILANTVLDGQYRALTIGSLLDRWDQWDSWPGNGSSSWAPMHSLKCIDLFGRG